MHREASEPRASDGSRLQRAVVLELLECEDQRGRPLGELGDELGAGDAELDLAVRSLHAAGVVCVKDGQAWASAAARRLDELELIAI
jgi:hypothetical protein